MDVTRLERSAGNTGRLGRGTRDRKYSGVTGRGGQLFFEWRGRQIFITLERWTGLDGSVTALNESVQDAAQRACVGKFSGPLQKESTSNEGGVCEYDCIRYESGGELYKPSYLSSEVPELPSLHSS